MTARAVGQRLWSSGVPPARRQQGRVESRHTALRSAYRVMAECRRSATMSADVGGDGGDETARAVGQRLWSSGVPPARRQQWRVKSRHAALRSAYRVMSECRRSATISADVCGDDVVARPLARSDSALLREAVMGVARPLRYDACLSGGERRVDQENVVGGTCERRI